MYICVIVSTVDVNDCIFCVNEQQKVYLKKQTLETNEASMEDLIDIHTPSFHELTFYCLINHFIFS